MAIPIKRASESSLPSGDLARRVAHRRRELGLSREEVARRAGITVAYLEFLEHSPSVALSRGQVIRLAKALGTTVDHLRGGTVDRPPGPGRAGPHPHLDVMSPEECEEHLSSGGVGRFVFTSESGPTALPVNYRLLDRDIVFSTRTHGVLSRAVSGDGRVGFEVDQIDDAMSEGWSVIISGRARLVDDPDELRRIAELGIEPWPGGRREALIRIETDAISGRRIRQASR
jgi:nitroimidazol reductase NimA-like FMN-containing flavoprotein (pyridoxamine 5'-phosphate oxidase superfamily)